MAGGDRLPIIIPLLDDKELASIDELDDHILLLETARRRLDVEWTESIGVFEDRKGHEVYRYPNMVAYLKHRARIAASRASRYVAAARSALRFKATFASWRAGQITTDQAQMLFEAARQLPDKYPAAEPVLLEIIGDTAEETQKTLDYWRRTVDRQGVDVDLDTQLARRRFDYSLRANGMIEGEFALTDAAGEALIAALDSAMPPPEAGDDRSRQSAAPRRVRRPRPWVSRRRYAVRCRWRAAPHQRFRRRRRSGGNPWRCPRDRGRTGSRPRDHPPPLLRLVGESYRLERWVRDPRCRETDPGCPCRPEAGGGRP